MEKGGPPSVKVAHVYVVLRYIQKRATKLTFDDLRKGDQFSSQCSRRVRLQMQLSTEELAFWDAIYLIQRILL